MTLTINRSLSFLIEKQLPTWDHSQVVYRLENGQARTRLALSQVPGLALQERYFWCGWASAWSWSSVIFRYPVAILPKEDEEQAVFRLADIWTFSNSYFIWLNLESQFICHLAHWLHLARIKDDPTIHISLITGTLRSQLTSHSTFVSFVEKTGGRREREWEVSAKEGTLAHPLLEPPTCTSTSQPAKPVHDHNPQNHVPLDPRWPSPCQDFEPKRSKGHG